MFKKVLLIGVVVLFSTTASSGVMEERGSDPLPRPVIYVTSQGLYYDSIVTADPLPPHGRFQLLEMGPMGLQTEFGKGDREYLGGRWKEDFDGDGVFHYFSCPLLGKGRPNP
jgi:hypothetical protein